MNLDAEIAHGSLDIVSISFDMTVERKDCVPRSGLELLSDTGSEGLAVRFKDSDIHFERKQIPSETL